VSAKLLGAIVGGCLIAAAPAAAQDGAPARVDAKAEAAARLQRYQISTLERVLEGAVEHGVTVTRDRLQAVAQMPTELLVSDNAHARGFRLEGYGVFFDVSVPQFATTLWTLQTLDQNSLGLDSAMKQLQQAVRGNTDAEQALRRIELQVAPVQLARPSQTSSTGARNATGAVASTVADAQEPAPPADPILSDPNDAYRTEVISALKEAMLDHSSSLGIQAGEWLTIAARGNDDRPRLAPADGVSRTRILRLSGADLLAYLARTIDKEEALKRIEVRVF
jgi:hypothetical protein